MTSKKVITVTLPNAIGGVASFNRNILKYFDRSLVFIRVILISTKENPRVRIQEGFNCDELIHFSFSIYENYYFVLKRLGLSIKNDTEIIFTDNGITLDALNIADSKATVLYLNHDFFYVKQALNHSENIDYCIAHSQFFNDCLASADYNAFENKVIHLPYGVEIPEKVEKPSNERLKLVFLGRLDFNKGILSLIEIETKLINSHIDVDWLIIGDGPLKKQVFDQWKEKKNVSFQQPSSTKEVYNLLLKQDILVFPSLFEGTPVAIFEAIACGCVPILYDIPGGVREFLKDDFSIKVQAKDTHAIFESISSLNNDRKALAQMQNLALNYAKRHLDQSVQNSKYFDLIFRSPNQNTSRSKLKMGFFDSYLVPNKITYALKYSKKVIKNLLNNTGNVI